MILNLVIRSRGIIADAVSVLVVLVSSALAPGISRRHGGQICVIFCWVFLRCYRLVHRTNIRNPVCSQIAGVIIIATARPNCGSLFAVVRDVLLLFVRYNVNPIPNVKFIFVEVVADVFEPHVPWALLNVIYFLLDEAVTKATPEMIVGFTAKVHLFANVLALLRIRENTMSLVDVPDEDVFILHQLAAHCAIFTLQLTSPRVL